MAQIEIVDRSPMIAAMKTKLRLLPAETAFITIDMHRGHLDPEIATMPTKPEDARRVIDATAEALGWARERAMPVVHLVLTYRKIPGLGSEGMSSPFWAAMSELEASDRLTPGRPSTIDGHNLLGSPGTEIIPALKAPDDYVIDNKKRLDCFMGTDLEMLLRNLQVRNVCLAGINTNTCVLNTAFTAHNYNYRTVVLSDCVASMYGEDLHRFALENVQRCLGWVLTNAELKAKLGASA